MKLRKILLVLLLIFLSITVSLSSIELFLRAINLNPNNFMRSNQIFWTFMNEEELSIGANKLYKYDEELGYENKEVFSKILGASITNDKFKILVIGDSVSEWSGYVEFLQDKVDEIFPNQVLIINTGTGGYNTEMEYRYLIERGLQANPDFVILQLHSNDIGGTPVVLNQGNEWVAFNNNSVATKINQDLFEASLLYRYVTALQLTRLTGQEADGESFDTLKQSTTDYLNKIVEKLDENQIPFLVTSFPILEINEFTEKNNAGLREIISNQKFGEKYVDVPSLFAKYSLEEISLDPHHPNEFGAKLASDLIAEKLINFLLTIQSELISKPETSSASSTVELHTQD